MISDYFSVLTQVRAVTNFVCFFPQNTKRKTFPQVPLRFTQEAFLISELRSLYTLGSDNRVHFSLCSTKKVKLKLKPLTRMPYHVLQKFVILYPYATRRLTQRT